MTDIIIVAVITAIPPTLGVLLTFWRLLRAEKKIEEVHTVIVKGHRKG